MGADKVKLLKGIGHMPSDWGAVKAVEVCTKVTKGTTPPKSEIVDDGLIPFLRVNNLNFNGHLGSPDDFLYVSEKAHRKFLARSIAYPNDILMNIVGPPLGKTARLTDRFPEYNMNQAIIIYRTKVSEIDVHFFHSYLKGTSAQQWLAKHSKKTSGQQNLTIEVCKNLPIPLPPLPEQKKIAEILSCWDSAIETIEKLIDAKTRFKKGLMTKILKGLRKETNIRLGDCAKVLGGFAFKSKEFEKHGMPVIRISNVQDSGIQLDDKTVCFNGKADDKFIISKGDILISMSGNVGRVARYEFTSPALLNQRVGKITRLDGEQVDERYLYQLLKSDVFLNHAESLSTSSAQANVSPSQLESFSFPRPLLDQQRRLGSLLCLIDEELEIFRASLQYVVLQKKGLMQQLLTGKIRVSTSKASSQATQEEYALNA